MVQENTKKESVLHVRISAASKEVWEGDAYSVTSENSEGKFDILGLHSNFITLIRNKPIVVNKVEGEKEEFNFKQSVILVTGNFVKVFADVAAQ
ncbi:hypothetical protein N9089_04860 [Crocinitomicaceae bacterium]|nr:hypothetical protein [Crocinitomicaceae bacterium]